MGTPMHGRNGLVYISGTEITGGNAWQINIATDTVEVPQFSDTWKTRVAGLNDFSGNITAWQHVDSKVIATAATARVAVSFLIYPDRSDLTDYYSGSAFFGMNSGGGMSAAVTRNGDFVGSGALTITGFA